MSLYPSASLLRQQGFSTIAMVMMLMLFGMLMLNGLSGQLTTQVKIYGDERRYLKAYNQALSSLAWGFSLQWPAAKAGWQCQRLASDGLSACLRSTDNNGVLIRGSGTLGFGEPDLALFQRGRQSEGGDPAINFIPLTHGYTDFCPLASAADCEPSLESKINVNGSGGGWHR
ncbi:YgdB family protein [Budvicia aquatica]|uniref:YgdB family protein n=1 Tax=Budvicia aquatica TaxID=82979 RepID=UPI002081C9A0|nr:YgdB family protein [Budvicia aquatica]GKX52662.1 membrane protein [Budvicia aquatica]